MRYASQRPIPARARGVPAARRLRCERMAGPAGRGFGHRLRQNVRVRARRGRSCEARHLGRTLHAALGMEAGAPATERFALAQCIGSVAACSARSSSSVCGASEFQTPGTPMWRTTVTQENEQASQNGKDLRGWIGVAVRPMTAAFAASLGMAVPYGAIFEQPEPGGPAANAHIEQGDVLAADAFE